MTKLSPIRVATVAAILALTPACASFAGGLVGNAAVPAPAKAVERDAYLGRWYEQARYEAAFQKGCEAVTADYALRDDGTIRVINSCREGSPDGKLRQSTGRARIVEGSAGAKLKVSFFGPFEGDYWVLDRGEPGADGLYPWAIVGEPSGRFLWILTRDARPDAKERSRLVARAATLGYDTGPLRETRH